MDAWPGKQIESRTVRYKQQKEWAVFKENKRSENKGREEK